ncbi:hypothetical protein BDB00DRAFT_789591 [Zychaea mexicana]|uniref:uncharacterized protein n=1 Tax=Zychaea mexicana TaxID=64656 RepID=UPI0022FF3A4B|nr:uncharacterized protein BDB00DRAFT_789591 [Zychaea mexicana]KAI9491461.1 hypothetical protein BDB00DRAFT_789591 [Zychaea mexicana]
MQHENSITEPSSATVIPESQLFTFNSNSSSMSNDGNKNKRRKGNPSNADESSEKKKTKSWSKDNVTPDSKSSKTILLEWLLEPAHHVSCKLNEWITNFNKANDLIGETGGGRPYGDGAIDNDEDGADEDKSGM